MKSVIIFLRKQLRPLKKWYKNVLSTIHVKRETKRLYKIADTPPTNKRVYYLGTCENSNYGDNAQYYCILKWIKEYLPNYDLIQFDATTVVDKRYRFIETFISIFRTKCDLIIFQSGYAIQDYGGNHHIMHKLILSKIPNAMAIIMPQTIFFQHQSAIEATAALFNKCPNLLLIARDKTSFDTATKWFHEIHLLCKPDIVTSLIGHYNFNTPKEGILILHRNDLEQYYSRNDIRELKTKLSIFTQVTESDTTVKISGTKIRRNLKENIDKQIQSYSKYKVIITDRFHGTIFSLCANTPVIVLKSADHKVTCGATWLEGIYKDYIKVANTIEDAIQYSKEFYYNYPQTKLDPYFETKYFSKALYDEIKYIYRKAIK
ncbi:polysaccharide pyruvyl transferase family protein [Bacteroides fragilis]|mgnify:FL=1|uniref:polysaccharide pyruvyl transferase family protein n=1 Tax=Bacteroides fragilis TaxID=817 RepID=UPI00202F2DCE|nr:polysaccharide pyruvyl transferase family protein [Bacteroides fragilis]MCM0270400.1 polysaccharide pyruvyl transferase family protein [Bacteroides fragilis]MCZ2603765.1 polysaccharide pyruvyl transferase family protein [Bacteroides fragilis]